MQAQHEATISEMRAAAAEASAMQLSEVENQAVVECRDMKELGNDAMSMLQFFGGDMYCVHSDCSRCCVLPYCVVRAVELLRTPTGEKSILKLH